MSGVGGAGGGMRRGAQAGPARVATRRAAAARGFTKPSPPARQGKAARDPLLDLADEPGPELVRVARAAERVLPLLVGDTGEALADPAHVRRGDVLEHLTVPAS